MDRLRRSLSPASSIPLVEMRGPRRQSHRRGARVAGGTIGAVPHRPVLLAGIANVPHVADVVVARRISRTVPRREWAIRGGGAPGIFVDIDPMSSPPTGVGGCAGGGGGETRVRHAPSRRGSRISLCVPTICDSEEYPIGHGVYIDASVINHSCVLISVQTFWLRPHAPPMLSVMTCRDVYPGDEITFGNFDLSTPRHIRRKTLLWNYKFMCDCALCGVDGGRRDNDEAIAHPVLLE
jgi:hypothetical protein